MEYLTIALAKGRLGNEAFQMFRSLGFTESVDLESRRLIFDDEKEGIRYVHVKPADVVTYVEKGVADLGVVGRDIILEQEGDIYEIQDLNMGKCKFSIAGLEGQEEYRRDEVLKVATKYPNITQKYFERRNQKIEIIKLNGSVELAPLVGLAHVVVDIVETGNTLRANGLKVFENICDISAKLIANRISYRFKRDRIQRIAQALVKERSESR